MTEPPAGVFDPLGIIHVLNTHHVAFVVIGGIAAGVQGAMWATIDVDIVYARNRENHDRLAAALADLAAAPVDLPGGVRVAVDARALAQGSTWTLMTRLGRLDLLSESGGLDYETLQPRSRPIEGQETYRVASVGDLIAMKRSAGRPKDAGHVELLERVAQELHDHVNDGPDGG